MFSILEPGKRIPEHRGPSTAFLRYHMGLKVPKEPGCHITVDDQKMQWKEGEAFIFDDTYPHSVQNNTSEPRIILFIDIERPALKGMQFALTPLADFSRNLNEVSEKELPME
jgi:aspartyl/asparaginyl beta-hydroxylase (cupin superfamily)